MPELPLEPIENDSVSGDGSRVPCLKGKTGLVTALVFSFGLVSTSYAGSFSGIHPLQSDRFALMGGLYWTNISSTASADKDGIIGGDIDFQDDLGFDETDMQPTFQARWRISDRSRLEAEFLSVGQGNSSTLKHTIDWDGIEFDVGVKVKGNFDLDVGRLFYGYSFIKDDKKEFGAGLGLHYLGLDTSLSGEASIGGIPIGGGPVTRGIDEWAILPNVGIYGNYALSSKWLLSGRADWISANIQDYDGTLWNAQASIQYQMADHFGVGLAYRYLALDLEEDSSKRRWDIDIDYNGPILFITANF